MKRKRIKTKYTGVYEQISPTKKHLGKPDRCYYITLTRNNKFIWEKVGWASEGYSPKLAVNIRGDRLRSIRHGEELPQDKKNIPLFRDAAKKYLEWAEQNRTKKGENEKLNYRKHLTVFDNKKLDEISPFHLEKFKRQLLERKKLAPQTAKHILKYFREIFNYGNKNWQLDLKNPVKEIKLPSTKNTHRMRFFTKEEINKLFEALEPYKQIHDIALISLRTGLRFDETTSIKGHDIDFKNGIISVIGKNQDIDYVYLTPDIIKILREYDTPLNEYMFKDRNGNKIAKLSKTFYLVIKKLGFNEGITDRRQKLTFHSLRHTFGSWLALNNEQLKTIQELMRHKSIEMTVKYAKLVPDYKKKAVARLME